MRPFPEVGVIETEQDASALRILTVFSPSVEKCLYVYDCLIATAEHYSKKGQKWPREIEDLYEFLFGNWSISFPADDRAFFELMPRLEELTRFEFIDGSCLANSLPFEKISTLAVQHRAGQIKDINMIGANGKLILLSDARTLITVLALGKNSQARLHAIRGILSGLDIIGQSTHVYREPGLEVLADQASSIAEVYLSRMHKGQLEHLEPREELLELFKAIMPYISKDKHKPMTNLISVLSLSRPVLNF